MKLEEQNLNEAEKPQLNIGAVSGSTGSERIICAAVWYKEIPIKKEIPFESTNPKNCLTGLVFSGHRQEALIIALRENQVMDINEIRGNRLFSEDLY
jgi:hypothetical protein